MLKKFLVDLLISSLMGNLGKELGDVVVAAVNAVASEAMYRNEPDKRAAAWAILREQAREAGREAGIQLSTASTTALNLLIELLVFRMKKFETKSQV